MYERKNDLKRAFYHILKIEMKKNRALGYEGYRQDNEELGRRFARGEFFENSVIFVEDGEIMITPDFFSLKAREQDALLEYISDVNGLAEKTED